MKNKKIYFFILLIIFFVSVLSCKKNNQQSEIKKINPDIEKVDFVYNLMSTRFKDEIKIEDKEAFLQDLNLLLQEEESFNKEDLSLFYLIDKKNYVEPLNYVPKNLVKLTRNSLYNINRNDLSLRSDVELALREMAQASLADGIKLMVSSTYRSYEYQTALFNRYVAQDGLELAERYSARAGTSQHQLGTAIDFDSIDDSFINTPMGQWLDKHSKEYGWSLSFPKGYEDVTGYMWECWHYRYIGKTACKMQEKWFNDVQQYLFEYLDAWKNN